LATQVLDFSTIADCLRGLEDETGPLTWHPSNDEQRQFFGWMTEHADQIKQLSNLTAKAARDYSVLNQFMVEHGFDPLFSPFDGVGVASILDMLVKWLYEGVVQTVFRANTHEPYPGFALRRGTVQVHFARFFVYPVAQVKTQSGHHLWVTASEEPKSGIDLAMTVQKLAEAPKHSASLFTGGLRMPMLDIDTQGDLSWLLAACGIDSEQKPWFITQAFQQFKLRLNQIGARVKVGTGVAMERGARTSDADMVLNRPFIGYFTQPGLDGLPLAAFYADTDSWKEPAGSLEDL
jgi:hypothetical protein